MHSNAFFSAKEIIKKSQIWRTKAGYWGV